ncbi:MAG: acyl-CoA synthetase [Myxococcota bacterium]|jgi:long-chain acyl-CoA synthetase|nr:acyl-CoA synthetase [Myxococcota bacterium]
MKPGAIISGERVLSREDLFRRASQASSGFDSLGVGAGDAVAIMLRNDFPFFEATFAAGRLGAHAVPINWHYMGEETEHILRDSGAKALVVHADLLPQIEESLPEGLTVLVVATPSEVSEAYGIDPDVARVAEGRLDWDEWVDAFFEWVEAPRDSPGAMIYTSGTTDRPKGVRRKPAKPEQLAIGRKIGAELYGFGTNMRAVVTGPMYHIAPNTFAIVAAAMGDRIVLQPRFDPEELLALIERHEINSLNLVPTMFNRLLRLPEAVRNRYDLSSLTNVVHNAAPCAPDIKRAMIEWWGSVIIELYGGTESGPAAACNSEEWLAHPGCVGRALPGSTLRILDDEGKELPRGEVGEVFMHSEANAEFTYHGREEERREIERSGLISLGDMGYLDEDGFLFLCDRKRDMVISGDVNIYPAEIESALIGVEGVADCAVFGIPDEEFGESLIAIIEPEEGAHPTADLVRTALERKLARYKIPKRIEFSAELPREDSGKIFKRKLRDQFWTNEGRRI